jgi:hypothetical protein
MIYITRTNRVTEQEQPQYPTVRSDITTQDTTYTTLHNEIKEHTELRITCT